MTARLAIIASRFSSNYLNFRFVLAWVRPLFFLSLISLLASCSHIQLVADYDATTYEETIRIGKSVDLFYATILDTKNEERVYDKYAAKYIEIEADIRSLVRRNAARELNQESKTISNNILGFWEKYRCNHKNRYRNRPLSNDEICDSYDECKDIKDEQQKSACTSRRGYPTAKFDRDRFSRLFNAAAAAEEAKLSPDDLNSTQTTETKQPNH